MEKKISIYSKDFESQLTELNLCYGDSVTCDSIAVKPIGIINKDEYPQAKVFIKLVGGNWYSLSKTIECIRFMSNLMSHPTSIDGLKADFGVGFIMFWFNNHKLGLTMHDQLSIKIL